MRDQKDLRTVKRGSIRSKIKEKIGTMFHNGPITDFCEK